MVIGRQAISLAHVLCSLQVQQSSGKIYIAFCNTFRSHVGGDNVNPSRRNRQTGRARTTRTRGFDSRGGDDMAREAGATSIDERRLESSWLFGPGSAD
jgi:hypothetical protein